MPQWAALALLRPVRRFEGIPYGNAQNAAGRLQSEAERRLRGFFDVAVTGHMSDMPCRARLHRGHGAPGTDGHGRAMPEKCRSKVSEKWPLKLHPAFSGSGSALKGHSRKCESVSGSHVCRALWQVCTINGTGCKAKGEAAQHWLSWFASVSNALRCV